MKIEVLVADDHAIIRDGIRNILADTDDMVVAGEAANGNTALDMVRERDWSLVVLDLSMPGRNGLDLIKLIKAERPRLPILVFSMHQEEQYAVRAIRAGASGYLTKESDSDLLLPALRRVAAGGVYVSQAVAEQLARERMPNMEQLPHNLLSEREYEVLMMILEGRSLTEIADRFSLSVKTVSTHKTRILQKMKMSSTVELVRYGMAHGLVNAFAGP